MVAVVSTYKWATKIHAAQIEMTVRPATYRSLCGKSWLVSTGQKFEGVELDERCERCEMARRLAPAA